MKINVSSIVLGGLLMLTMVSCAQGTYGTGYGGDSRYAAANTGTTTAPAAGNSYGNTNRDTGRTYGGGYSNSGMMGQVIVIKLKYITPDKLVDLSNDPYYHKVFPDGILGIAGVPDTQNLIVKASSQGAITQLTEFISLFDVPQTRFTATVMLVYADKSVTLPQGPLTAGQFAEHIKQWVSTRRASVVTLPDTAICGKHTMINVPAYAPNVGVIDFTNVKVADSKEITGNVTFFGPNAVTETVDGRTNIRADWVSGKPVQVQPDMVYQLLLDNRQGQHTAAYVSIHVIKDTAEDSAAAPEVTPPAAEPTTPPAP